MLITSGRVIKNCSPFKRCSRSGHHTKVSGILRGHRPSVRRHRSQCAVLGWGLTQEGKKREQDHSQAAATAAGIAFFFSSHHHRRHRHHRGRDGRAVVVQCAAVWPLARARNESEQQTTHSTEHTEHSARGIASRGEGKRNCVCGAVRYARGVAGLGFRHHHHHRHHRRRCGRSSSSSSLKQ